LPDRAPAVIVPVMESRVSPPVATRRFDVGMLAGLPEPVRRYFAHAIADGAPLASGARLTMRGQIRLGAWMPFRAVQESRADAFRWRARVAAGLFGVTDRFAAGRGVMDVRLFGRARLVHADDEHTTRSAATRAALEAATYAPPVLLGHPGVAWEARSGELIVASWDVGPERPEVHVRIADNGAVRSVSALRWGNQGTRRHQYIACGCEVHAERRFGPYVLPSAISVGWWWETPRYAPFFRAQLTNVVLGEGHDVA